jgi:hypothetical protein
MPAAEQLELGLVPAASWTETATLRTREGGKLKRWGSVEKACAILDGIDRGTLYGLIRAGLIDAYKINPGVRNSHWRVDLLSVWRHKHGQGRR